MGRKAVLEYCEEAYESSLFCIKVERRAKRRGRTRSASRVSWLDLDHFRLHSNLKLEPIKLHDWLVTFAQDQHSAGWSVVAWGRGDASTSSARSPLKSYRMVERVSEQSFQDEEGNLVELVGPCDTVRAQQAGKPLLSRRALDSSLLCPLAGVPPAVLDGFKDGIPPAWGMLLGIADSIYSATRKLPFPHLPHGASQPSSPQILPYSGALIDYSDDEALPESLFDFGTGYKRPEGAPRTARQLAEVWEGLSAAHMVEEDIIVREDRDAAYDEEAQDEEEEGEPLPEMEGRAEVASPSLVDGSLQEEQHSDMTPETARGIAPQTLATPAKMSSPEPVHLPSPKDSPPIVPPSLPPINDVAYTETSEALVMATSQPGEPSRLPSSHATIDPLTRSCGVGLHR